MRNFGRICGLGFGCWGRVRRLRRWRFWRWRWGLGRIRRSFSVLNALLLRPPPFAQADRLVMLYEKRVKQGRERNPVSSPDFIDWRQQNRVFLGMDAFL